MLKIIRRVFILLNLTLPLTLSAREHHIHSSAGLGGSGLPLYVAKSTGIFEKYGLNVDLLVIPGGPLGMQVLFSGGGHFGENRSHKPYRKEPRGGGTVVN